MNVILLPNGIQVDRLRPVFLGDCTVMFVGLDEDSQNLFRPYEDKLCRVTCQLLEEPLESKES